jgi:nocturnin
MYQTINGSDDNPFMIRKLITINDSNDDNRRLFKVRTMNILADQCAKNDSAGFPHVEPSVLEWDNRKQSIIDQLVIDSPDFICLQEVDHWHDWFQPELAKYGYEGVFHNYGTSALDKNKQRHGCCLLYKSDIWGATFYFNEIEITNPYVSIFGYFSSKYDKIVVGVTHLKAKSQNKHIRLIQGQNILDYIKTISESMPVIIAGDFNADPDEPVCDLFRVHFTSVYADVERNDHHFTTIKQREKLYKRTIDYIWYSSKCKLVRRSSMVKDIQYPYLPNENYPSDHLTIVAEFSI